MIRLCEPIMDEQELAEVASVLQTGFLTQGKKVQEFETRIKELVGTRYGFAMSSCTTALHLSLVALGVGPGDEVLVSDFTFPATANVVVQQGATPVLLDVRPDTYNVDVTRVEQKITKRTKAALPVHAFGLSCDMDPFGGICGSHGIPVVEDAACALGSLYKGKACGSMGVMGCFSFHPRKSITTGEGGMIVTDREDLASRIATLRNHGGVKGEFYAVFEDAGFNYRLSDVLAALGVAQFRKRERLMSRRREIAALYARALASVDGVTPPIEPDGLFHTFQSYVVLLAQDVDRDAVLADMRSRQIECTLGTYALHAQPFYQRLLGHRPGDLPGSYRAFRSSVSLPMHPAMTDQQVQRVAEELESCVRKAPRRALHR